MRTNTLALITLLLSACGGSSPPPARCGDGVCDGTESSATCCTDCACAAGQLCSGTTNQCFTSVCGDGVCDSTETSATCCTDCACGTGQLCSATTKACFTSVCGDGVCDSTETSATCCADCACATGMTCQSNACVAATAVFNWTITDACNDTESTWFKMYEYDSQGAAVGVWPTATTHWVLASGGTLTESLTCTLGDSICFGAYQATHNYVWGVDYDDSQTCTNCCQSCANASLTTALNCQ